MIERAEPWFRAWAVLLVSTITLSVPARVLIGPRHGIGAGGV
jgi:hypothetical protein